MITQVFLLLHKYCQPQIKIEVAIFHIATFNYALCNVIGHLTFQMRKVLVTIKPPDILHCVVWIAGHGITFCHILVEF